MSENGNGEEDRRLAGERPYMCKNYAHNVLGNLNSLRYSGKFCDVELISGDTSIKAHRLVLSGGSAYFAAMFGGGLAEERRSTVPLPTVPPQALVILIDFIYTGQVMLSRGSVQEVLAAADMLQLPELVAGCQEFLIRELHPSNAIGIYMFAEAHNCSELAAAALEHIQWNFSAASRSDELLQLPAALLARLLGSEQLRVDSELQVLLAALRWLEHAPAERRRHVFRLLGAVRLALLPAPALDRAVLRCRDSSLRVALRNHRADLVSRKGALVELEAMPRTRARRHLLLLGGSCREPPRAAQRATDTTFNSVLQFDLQTEEWKELSSMSTGRILPGVAALGGRVWAVGGEQGSQILADGEVYDPQADLWSPVVAMSVARCEFGLAAWRGCLYALGGWVGEDIGASVESFDPNRGTWTPEPPMPEPRFSMGVVTYDGLIYVVGGCTHAERHLRSLLAYNPVTGQWRPLAPMRTARSQAGVAVLDNFLYVVGGNSKSQEVLSTVERYNFDEDTWSNVSCMSVGRASPAVVAAEGRLLVAGGDQLHEGDAFYRARASMASAELYDPRRDLWRPAPSLPQPRSEAGAAAL